MYWIEIIGTFAFAISGIRLAAAKQFDLFGLFIVGFVTAVGGGATGGIGLYQDSSRNAISSPLLRRPFTTLTTVTVAWMHSFISALRYMSCSNMNLAPSR